MPTRETAPIGAPCWADLMTPDTARRSAFHPERVGWQARRPNEQCGGYAHHRTRGRPWGGAVSVGAPRARASTFGAQRGSWISAASPPR